jgi:hypothetical protein
MRPANLAISDEGSWRLRDCSSDNARWMRAAHFAITIDDEGACALCAGANAASDAEAADG